MFYVTITYTDKADAAGPRSISCCTQSWIEINLPTILQGIVLGTVESVSIKEDK